MGLQYLRDRPELNRDRGRVFDEKYYGEKKYNIATGDESLLYTCMLIAYIRRAKGKCMLFVYAD